MEALAGNPLARATTSRDSATALIEIRQDLIASAEAGEKWAERFARLLKPLAAQEGLRSPKVHASRTRERLRRH